MKYRVLIGFNSGKARFEIGDIVTEQEVGGKLALRSLLQMGAVEPIEEED